MEGLHLGALKQLTKSQDYQNGRRSFSHLLFAKSTNSSTKSYYFKSIVVCIKETNNWIFEKDIDLIMSCKLNKNKKRPWNTFKI